MLHDLSFDHAAGGCRVTRPPGDAAPGFLDQQSYSRREAFRQEIALHLNADFTRRAVVHAGSLDWASSLIPGVHRRTMGSTSETPCNLANSN